VTFFGEQLLSAIGVKRVRQYDICGIFFEIKKCHKSVTKKKSKIKLSQICDKIKIENKIVTAFCKNIKEKAARSFTANFYGLSFWKEAFLKHIL